MFSETAIAITLLCGTASVLILGAAFTPIVPGDSDADSPPSYTQNATQEGGYCASYLKGVDCGCFGSYAGHVKTEPGLDIADVTTIDRTELARMQALDSCKD